MSERTKVFAYVVRTDRASPGLLAFVSLDEPGFEVPKGSVEAGETLEQAVIRNNRTRHSERSEESRLSLKGDNVGRFSRRPGT
jgi:ADP-ribose pyrophosphatase YjhB (NUDIX family)